MHSYMCWQRRLSVYAKISCLELKLVLKRMTEENSMAAELYGCIWAPKEVEPMSMFCGLFFDGSHHRPIAVVIAIGRRIMGRTNARGSSTT